MQKYSRKTRNIFALRKWIPLHTGFRTISAGMIRYITARHKRTRWARLQINVENVINSLFNFLSQICYRPILTNAQGCTKLTGMTLLAYSSPCLVNTVRFTIGYEAIKTEVVCQTNPLRRALQHNTRKGHGRLLLVGLKKNKDKFLWQRFGTVKAAVPALNTIG